MTKKKLILILAFTAVAFIVTAILLFTGPRMKVQSSIRTFESRAPLPPDDIISFYPNRQDLDRKGVNALPAASNANLKRGEVYYSYYCTFCHGDNGRGNGPVGQSYMPKPADLTQVPSKNYSPQELYRVTFTGAGHSPVLKRVIPFEHRAYLLLFIKEGMPAIEDSH